MDRVGDEQVIRRGPDGELQLRRARAKDFGARAQKRFLEHFAATCNVKAAAKAAGVSVSAVYKRRSFDPAFLAAWDVAQEQGYASLEAALLQRARETAENVVPDEAALDDNYRISFKDALHLLQTQQQARGRKPGEQLPRRSDVREATERLVKVLKGLKIEPVFADAAGPREGDGGAGGE